MPVAVITVMASFHAGAILTLVLPLAVLIAVVAWYVWLWRHGAGEG